jgi:hypothetical protein
MGIGSRTMRMLIFPVQMPQDIRSKKWNPWKRVWRTCNAKHQNYYVDSMKVTWRAFLLGLVLLRLVLE